MLKKAIFYKKELKKKYTKNISKEKFKYANMGSYYDYDLDIKTGTWHRIQYVSVDNNENIIGFLEAKVDRDSNTVTGFLVMNFEKSNIIFSKDLYKFIDDIFCKYNLRKINFGVITANPARKMYDKFVEKFNGRVVGVKKDHYKLIDNKYYDSKIYEIMREDYIKAKCSKRGQIK